MTMMQLQELQAQVLLFAVVPPGIAWKPGPLLGILVQYENRIAGSSLILVWSCFTPCFTCYRSAVWVRAKVCSPHLIWIIVSPLKQASGSRYLLVMFLVSFGVSYSFCIVQFYLIVTSISAPIHSDISLVQSCTAIFNQFIITHSILDSL